MPKLIPAREDFEQAARQIIAESQPLKPTEVIDAANATKSGNGMSLRLDDVGLTREEIAYQLKLLALGAEKEETKHQVLKTALQLHGELKDQEVKAGINIVFVGAAPDLMNVLLPR